MIIAKACGLPGEPVLGLDHRLGMCGPYKLMDSNIILLSYCLLVPLLRLLSVPQLAGAPRWPFPRGSASDYQVATNFDSAAPYSPCPHKAVPVFLGKRVP